VAYHYAGQQERAVPLLEETLALITQKLGPDHPDTLTTTNSLAGAYLDTEKNEQALPLLQRLAEGIEKRGFAHEHAGMCIGNLALCYEKLERWDQAELWRRKWSAVVRERSGPESLAYAAEIARLGADLVRQEKWDEAETVVRECVAIRKERGEATPAFSGGAGLALTRALERLEQRAADAGQEEEAERWRVELRDEQARQQH